MYLMNLKYLLKYFRIVFDKNVVYKLKYLNSNVIEFIFCLIWFRKILEMFFCVICIGIMDIV